MTTKKPSNNQINNQNKKQKPMLPLIPILAIAAIIGGIATLNWYSSLTREEQRRADSLAMKWFGKQFQQLAEKQQEQIKRKMTA